MLGVVHGVIQVGLGVGALFVWRQLVFDQLDWPLPIIAATALYGPILAVASAEVVALYLLVASRFGVNVNELFAGQGIQGYKGFLRMHIDRDGTSDHLPDRPRLRREAVAGHTRPRPPTRRGSSRSSRCARGSSSPRSCWAGRRRPNPPYRSRTWTSRSRRSAQSAQRSRYVRYTSLRWSTSTTVTLWDSSSMR